MSELPSQHILAPLRRAGLASLCTLPLVGFSPLVLARNVPAGLRACATESDPGKRLACYDREMSRLTGSARAATGPPTAAAPARPAAPWRAAPRPVAAESTAASTPKPAATSAPANASGRPAPVPRRTPVWKRIFSGGAASRVTARVARLDRSPDAMLLHLDNGQVWRQVGRASGALGLHAGDTVTIEKHLGSYYLSSRYVSDMQVRLEAR